MSMLAKVFVVLNLVLALVFVTVASVVFSQQEYWKERATHFEANALDTQHNLEALKQRTDDEIKRLNGDLKKWQGEESKRRAELADANDRLEILQGTLASERQKYADLRGSFNTLWREIEDQKVVLRNTQQELNTTQEKLRIMTERWETAELERVRLHDDKRVLSQLREELQRKVDELAEANGFLKVVLGRYRRWVGTTLALQIEKPRTEELPVGYPIEGRILAVDNEEGVVIISVGRKDRVRKDYRFLVYREGAYIAQITVFKVDPDKAAARINWDVSPKPRKAVERGDRVTTRISMLQ